MYLKEHEMDYLQERVRAGAAWLDGVDPSWRERIDLGRLQLAECCECILGQLYGNYAGGLDALRESLDDWDTEGSDLGFDYPVDALDDWNVSRHASDTLDNWALDIRSGDVFLALNDLWRMEIANG